jgi:subtilisin family serine protease
MPVPIEDVAWVRVDDPDHPGALARSEAGSILPEPPERGAWNWEVVPHLDGAMADGEMVRVLGLESWHLRGARGAGVKVAVFDLQWFGVDDAVSGVESHDCWLHPSCEPAMDDLRPRFSFERGVHGTACAEVVASVAPDAELHVVRVNSRTLFENAVEWAIREDVDVVSMSMSFFNLSAYDGSGPFASSVTKLREAGILLVSSAGNYARGHHAGPWRDVDADGRYDGDGTNAVSVFLRPGAGRLYLSWNQYSQCGLTDLDLVVYGPSGRIVGRGLDDQNLPVEGEEARRCSPVEAISDVVEEGWHRVEVFRRRGSTTGLQVDLLAPGGRVEDPVGGSVVDPGVQPATFTVGAVDVARYLDGEAAAYSSRGPSVGGWNKPDIAGPDGLTTGTYGVRGFFGTSAATPAVAGLVAVVMSDEPGITSYEAADRLRAWAHPFGTPGVPDPALGAGVARLPDLAASAGCTRQPLVLGFALYLCALGVVRRRQKR